VRSWNFGPAAEHEVTVREIAQRLCALWGGDAGFEIVQGVDQPREAEILRLESAKAGAQLGWRPVWSLDQALAATTGWFKAFRDGADMAAFSAAQIASYEGA